MSSHRAAKSESRITLSEKLVLFAIFGFAYAWLYQYPNFYPPFEPVYLPMTWIDHAVPFWPWTFYIYLSDYLIFISVIAWLNTPSPFYLFARRMFIALLIGGAFFYLFPTIYPRPEYPWGESAHIDFVMRLIVAGDKPTNCLPSMHVALTALAFLSVPRRNRLVHALFGLWALSIFLCTLTTKQHYVVDIVAGLVVCWLSCVLEPALGRVLSRARRRLLHRDAWKEAEQIESGELGKKKRAV